MRLLRRLAPAAVLAAAALAAAPARAGTVISSGPFDVSISDFGNLEPDTATGSLVFRRNADGYDPIIPGTPREAYGVSANGVSGYADTFFFGVSNIAPVSAVFGASTATVVTDLVDPGSGASLLRITQDYRFAADNVLQICTTVTNVSPDAQAVLFSRNVDMDLGSVSAPNGQFYETITADGVVPPVIEASFYGFENPDPLPAFSVFPAPATGGTFGPSDLGGGMRLDLGILAPGESSEFAVFHGIGDFGQTEADLRAQMAALGVFYQISGIGPETGNVESMGLGPCAIPEPTSLALVGIGAAGLAGYARRRRAATA
ncbi:MAG: PEP-CTERM sorting domain-containing protein [Gemmataceae bacterium]|nr:PEP-CTERM sorting domain-containing protein [Gemmataceae bacterium]